jgi:hypothetical protein
MVEGRTAFLGPVDEATPFFFTLGFRCPPNYNPAEFYIRTLATTPGKEMEAKEKRKKICDAYVKSQASRRIFEKIKFNRVPIPSNSSENEMSGKKVQKSPYKASIFDQFRAVLWRSLISVFREPAVLRVKSFQIIVGISVYLKPQFF